MLKILLRPDRTGPERWGRIDNVNKDGDTILHAAAMQGQLACLQVIRNELLLRMSANNMAGADPSLIPDSNISTVICKKNNSGQTARDIARLYGYEGCERLLAAMEADTESSGFPSNILEHPTPIDVMPSTNWYTIAAMSAVVVLGVIVIKKLVLRK